MFGAKILISLQPQNTNTKKKKSRNEPFSSTAVPACKGNANCFPNQNPKTPLVQKLHFYQKEKKTTLT